MSCLWQRGSFQCPPTLKRLRKWKINKKVLRSWWTVLEKIFPTATKFWKHVTNTLTRKIFNECELAQAEISKKLSTSTARIYFWYWNNINEHNLNIPETITSNTINDDVDRGVNHQEQMTNWDQAHQDQGRTKSISTSLHFGSQGAFENTEANSEKKCLSCWKAWISKSLNDFLFFRRYSFCWFTKISGVQW